MLAQNQRGPAAPAEFVRLAPGYVPIPISLLRAYAHDTLTIGCYAAIARCALAAKAPVPISPSDLAHFSGDARPATRTQCARRLQWLIDDAWLDARVTPGQKTLLLPTWGRSRGAAPRPWSWDLPRLGRPSAVALIALPQILLDDAIGRLTPQAGRTPAVVTRLLSCPVLTLADVGAAALILAGIATTHGAQVQALIGAATQEVGQRSSLHLLQRAAAGSLQGWHDGQAVAAELTPYGHQRYAAYRAGQRCESFSGSASDSLSESFSGSASDSLSESPDSAAGWTESPQDVRGAAPKLRHMNLRDNHDQEFPPAPPITRPRESRGADALIGEEETQALLPPPRTPENEPPAPPPAMLDATVRAQHCALNPGRAIDDAEWAAIARLQAEHGTARLRAWQARAGRATRPGSAAIVPAYYATCAAREQAPPPPTADRPAMPALDPERAALCVAMGITAPAALRDLAVVDLTLLRAWKAILDDPTLRAGLVASGKLEPIGFAVAQLKAGIPPPDPQTLRRWIAARPSSAYGSGQRGGIRSVSAIPPEEWAAMSPDERNALIAAQADRVNWRAAR